MTGRELIIYILKNHLEDKEMFENGRVTGFLYPIDFAVKKRVGLNTVLAWVESGMVPSVKICGHTYIPENAEVKKQ